MMCGVDQIILQLRMLICVPWDSCKRTTQWPVMEGSSDSVGRRSRSLNPSFVDSNPRTVRVQLYGDNASQGSGSVSVRKGWERNPWPHTDNPRAQIVGSEAIECSDVSLRQWLDNQERRVDSLECLHIFSQIVDIVRLAHSQGIVVQNVRPSCFVMSSFNRVSFIESASCSDSGSDSQEYEFTDSSLPLTHESQLVRNQADGSETSCLQSYECMVDKKHCFPMKQILLMESNWYSSPEEASSSGSLTCASDIYQLGVLLFELFCTFGSTEEKNTTMASLKHRVLPPQLLLKWPKVASFCLWLLHPEPSSRPRMSDLSQSEFLNEPKNDIEEREAAIELRERIEEQELLLEFLLLLRQRKQNAADFLNETISVISSDIEEVMKMQTSLTINITEDDDSGARKRVKHDITKPLESDDHTGSVLSKSSRLMKNFRKLESAYFLTRQRDVKLNSRALTKDFQIISDGRGWITTFLEGLCKYLSYSKLKVKADLKQGDFLTSSNLVCSLSFDRDGEFFATAGVNKKIKVFDYNSILSEDRDIHYPVVEMASRSKLSSICWNSYIKSQIASSNFEGVVQVWDVTRSQTFMEMREHERRVWSVDFSVADPTMLASGSDDGSVKLWNINQGVSVGTIKTKANVCCVQFPTDSGRSLAFGSADHKIYYYDLRNSKVPLCTLVGHNKTVSYVKFIDSKTLVSASTDNSLKLWDLSMCTSRVLDCPLQSFTGHLNRKNFVGLSVSEGYIATGSETNEVFIYHKAFPMPALSFKFSSTDPFSGCEVDDAAQFISSICWREQSTTLVAANSMGNIKLLEMV